MITYTYAFVALGLSGIDSAARASINLLGADGFRFVGVVEGSVVMERADEAPPADAPPAIAWFLCADDGSVLCGDCYPGHGRMGVRIPPWNVSHSCCAGCGRSRQHD